jgi:hypothetical protein
MAIEARDRQPARASCRQRRGASREGREAPLHGSGLGTAPTVVREGNPTISERRRRRMCAIKLRDLPRSPWSVGRNVPRPPTALQGFHSSTITMKRGSPAWGRCRRTQPSRR